MAKSKTIRVSEDELIALKAFREAQSNKVAEPEEVAAKVAVASEAQQALADAFVAAIERTKTPEKKTVANRKINTPWAPAGETRLKLRRKFFHHGFLIEDKVTNQDIGLLNQVKPGVYCDGFVRVTLRKDRGLDVDYPVRTSSQRLKLINTYGIKSFTELLQRLVDEKSNPAKYRKPEDADLYELDA